MDSSVSRKDQIWFLRMCHHVSNVLYYSGSTINIRSCSSCPSRVSQRFHIWRVRLILHPYWRHRPIQTLSKSFLRQVERHSRKRITISQDYRTVTLKNGVQILNPDIKTTHFLTCYTLGSHHARYLHASMKTEMPKTFFFNPDASLVAYRYKVYVRETKEPLKTKHEDVTPLISRTATGHEPT